MATKNENEKQSVDYNYLGHDEVRAKMKGHEDAGTTETEEYKALQKLDGTWNFVERSAVIAKGEIPDDIMKILKNTQLFNEITDNEFDKKIVGEKETRKVIFLCAAGGRCVKNNQIASYNLLVNDDAGVGKDYVVAAVLDILPTEQYIHKTRISPAVFTYWHNPQYEPDWSWDGKVFYPEDISEMVLNSDVFKVMCSKGSSATVVIKQRAYEIDIKGKPVMITTTASATPNPELARRFAILNLDSSEDQTKLIMARHSQFKKKGTIPEYSPDITLALSYLQQVRVKIPFADKIDKHFPTKNVIMRTHYPRFLDFISASAAFHQYQRSIDEEGFVLATGTDYEIARACFLKLSSNKYMIPLTITQKNILDKFEKEPMLKGSASGLHAKMGFVSLPALLTNLGHLVRYGILQTDIEKDLSNRDIEVYSLATAYNPSEHLEIPRFEDIMQVHLGENTLAPLQPLLPLEPLTPLAPALEDGGIKGIQGIQGKKGTVIE